jgi:hypothetical protein
MSHTAQKLYEPRHKEHGFARTSWGLHMMAPGYIKSKLSGLVIRGQIHIIHNALIDPHHRNRDKPEPYKLNRDCL